MSSIKINSEVHWHELRKNNIGGSDAATLFNCNKFQSPYSLWLTKHGLIDSVDSGNDRSLWGQRFESPIAEGLADDYGWDIYKAQYYQHPTIKGMGCTPDYIIKHSEFAEIDQDERMQGDGVFEIKNLEAWGYFSEFTQEEANHYIEVQIQHQLACTGLKWAVLGYKLPGQTPAIQFKTRDDEFIKLLEAKIIDFWNSSTPPTPDGTDSSSEAVRALYRRQQGKDFIDMSDNNHLPELVAGLESLKIQKKPLAAEIAAIEKVEKGIKNQIMAISEGGEIIKFQGGEIKINTITRKPTEACIYQTITYKLNKEES